MYLNRLAASILLTCFLAAQPASVWGQAQEAQGIRAVRTVTPQAVLWNQPSDIAARDLFFGPGGKEKAPKNEKFTFVKEDMDGTSPKFDVRDSKGTVWKVKLGRETRPETVATRLVWAVGYHADEDYFMPRATVAEMPRLKRGERLIAPGGIISDARFERVRETKKLGEWRWKKNVYSGTRELNGLRIVMALINSWDLKDVNNSIFVETADASGDNHDASQILLVTDLGATFGSPGFSWPGSKAKGNLKAFAGSKFISKVTDNYVDFKTPARPALLRIVALPQYIGRLKMRWIGRRIPRSDVQWMGQLLSQLSSKQIRDAFRAGGYSPDEVESFARVVEARIADLQKL